MYVVEEGNGSVSVCINVREPEIIRLTVAATVETVDDTAIGVSAGSLHSCQFLQLTPAN